MVPNGHQRESFRNCHKNPTAKIKAVIPQPAVDIGPKAKSTPARRAPGWRSRMANIPIIAARKENNTEISIAAFRAEAHRIKIVVLVMEFRYLPLR
jgi:hypothetical protein